MKHPKIPQTEVLAWLQENFPELHEAAEIDREWIWLVVDLRGESNKPVREAIKEYGFRFHRGGGHALQSGKVGTWGHSCERPTRFMRHGRKQEETNSTQESVSDEAILAMFG